MQDNKLDVDVKLENEKRPMISTGTRMILVSYAGMVLIAAGLLLIPRTYVHVWGLGIVMALLFRLFSLPIEWLSKWILGRNLKAPTVKQQRLGIWLCITVAAAAFAGYAYNVNAHGKVSSSTDWLTLMFIGLMFLGEDHLRRKYAAVRA